MRFEPIAIVGQSCTLPGAHGPEELWANVHAGRSCISSAPEGRWGLSRRWAMGSVDNSQDRTWTDAGGYVDGFEQRFDPSGFALPSDEVRALDPVFRMTLHGVREALRSAGCDGPFPSAGLVLGNLSFPSVAAARFAQSVWLDDPNVPATLPRPHARNRFNSGLPAHLAARALGLEAGALALDAACASSLYAIKLACDRLHDRSAELMVAGAVNQADDLFIHIGFCALSAMSKTGRSRPFHRGADGLVPAEGAAFVVLQRLSDALASGRKVLGVIRGIGLSNDGRGRGLLAPSEEGQERAMRLAYASAELSPSEVGLVECHATGTSVGDATEIRAMSRVFAGAEVIPIGSLKSNLGHLITAAGAAGLLKVLAAMEHGRRPASLHADEPIDALSDSPFRVLHHAEPWTGPRRAAISAFGFGGNNAHLLVEALDETRSTERRLWSQSPQRAPVAIVGIGARVGQGESARDFCDALFSGHGSADARQTVRVALEGLKFPPADLSQALAQQTLVLEAAREAAQGLSLPRERTAVLVGMGCDAEVSRYGARWRLAEGDGSSQPVDETWLAQARDSIVSALQASGVVGTMPNIPANRLNSQLDVAGPSFSLSAEEASGTAALHLAARALSAGEIDAALVGAVDLSHEPVHQHALKELGSSAPPGDAAVVLTLKRLDDAKRDGDPIYATLEPAGRKTADALRLGDSPGAFDLTASFGKAHAAHGLLHVAAAALALRHGAHPQMKAQASPWLGERAAEIRVSVLEAEPANVSLKGGTVAPWVLGAPARLHVFSGASRDEALAALATHRESNEGPARLVIVAAGNEELSSRARQARDWLTSGGPVPEGVAFCDAPIKGQVASVFTGAAAAYAGMGRELALALPRSVDALRTRFGDLSAATAWLFGKEAGTPEHPLDQLWGASFVCQLHAEVMLRLLKLKPDAAIGYSSGESNSLFAMGAWNDLPAMIEQSRSSPVFQSELVGEFRAPRRAWKRLGVEAKAWASFIVSAPLDQVRAALTDEPLVHLTIINTLEDCVIGGEANACQRVIVRLGPERVLPLGYEMAAHCPEVEEIREAWWHLHRRSTRAVPGVRFYTNASNASYYPTAETAADAITGQAIRGIDFAKTIERAWDDGVRIFVEHGPRGSCSGWIRRVLRGKEHLAVSLDVFGRSGVRQLLNATAWLVAAGVDVDARALQEALAEGAAPAPKTQAMLTLAAHPPPPRLPSKQMGPQLMPPAPLLEPVLHLQEQRIGHTLPATVEPSHPPSPSSLLQSQVAALHRDFLTQQAAAHARFLSVQQTASNTLLRAYSAMQGRTFPAELSVPPASQQVGRPALDHTRITPPLAPRMSPGAVPPPGLKLDRAQLEVHASGKISSVFGPQFASQDGFARQVRMPKPPLLLADRVTGIDGAPGSMGKGTVWTETDVRADSWYLNDEGRMPAGLMIEAGQADLLLISWLGVDALNRGERVYRLLGCELTYHGELPLPGDTLSYEIHVDGHANQGDVRLFFFHYDCTVRGQQRLTVRNGQAGFFTDEELASSAGVLWDPLEEPPADAPVASPAAVCKRSAFNANELRSFAEGSPFECFGPGWESTQPHVRSPRITSGKMRFLDEVTCFDPKGGPWRRGYLRAETAVTPDAWFFDGHFKNDPCMPGTLMFEGCLQAMAIYLAALGYTIERDGWRFEPVPGHKIPMRCRGQVTPSNRRLVYEIFVSEVAAGPVPTLYADLLCTVDGRKAFHARRMGLQLVPDWPLERWKLLGPGTTQKTGAPVALASLAGLAGYVEPKPVASADGFPFDYHSLLACAWGRPSDAFGPFYRRFDGDRRAARLPGPPYHFMSRITRLDGPLGGMKPGSEVEVEYDVPAEQWYFEQSGHPTMPFCVVMEAALQPCGWLASYVGSALTREEDLLFRNLDGTGTLLAEIPRGGGTFKTKARLLTVSQGGGMIIESFEVQCSLGEQRLFDLKTVFGFFPKEAFENQVGLPVTPQEQVRLMAPSDRVIDLSARPAKYFEGAPRLPEPMLLMLDRITAFAPTGGDRGLGYVRAEKDVDPSEWFFKAHFFQDPVQPGSLGIEALCQLLQFFMLEKGLAQGMNAPRFEPLMLERPVTWKYRGQVVPKNKVITTELQIAELGEDARGRFAVAEGWLWVDGKRIYHAKNLGMRIVSEAHPPSKLRAPNEEQLDPRKELWLADHCPTWTLPALPLMSMVDRLALAAQQHSGSSIRALEDVRVHRWLVLSETVRLRTEVSGDDEERSVKLLAWREAQDPALSRFEPVATGRVLLGAPPPPPPAWVPLTQGVPEPNPYESGALFHGPAFQYLSELRIGSTGSSATLDAALGAVPRGTLHQGLLDAATHGIPHDALWRWSEKIPRDQIGYPFRLERLHAYAPLPEHGLLRLESRFAGFDGDERFPIIDVQVIKGERVLVAFRLIEVLLPRGPIGAAPPLARRSFLRDRHFVPGIALSSFEGERTHLSETCLRETDWLPGNVAHIYGVPDDHRSELLTEVAARDHSARQMQVHPSQVRLEAGGARLAARPLRRIPLTIERGPGEVCVSSGGSAQLELSEVRGYWRERFNVGAWPVEDLYYGLAERFVQDVVLSDPEAFSKIQGRSCLYLANHQVGIESLLFSVLVSALSRTPTVTLAKAEHRTSWLGTLIANNFSYPGVVDPKVITFFDRDDRRSLFRIIGELGEEMRTGGKSVMVHVEGTRALACRQPVRTLSSVFMDLALDVGAPIIPVRFVGGLPVDPLSARLEFPTGSGRQEYWLGRPILPEELSSLRLKDRKALLLSAMNSLGPELSLETPFLPDLAFSAAADTWSTRTGASLEDAVLFATLKSLRAPSEQVLLLLEAAEKGRLKIGAEPRAQWLGRLARQLFGPRGPLVEGLQ